jgi:hypothetical protein
MLADGFLAPPRLSNVHQCAGWLGSSTIVRLPRDISRNVARPLAFVHVAKIQASGVHPRNPTGKQPETIVPRI